MDENQIKQEFTRIADEAKKSVDLLKEELKAATAGKASEETIKQLRAELAKDTENLKEAMEKQGMEMQSLKERNAAQAEPKTFSDAIKEALNDSVDDLAKLYSGQIQGRVAIATNAVKAAAQKAAATMTTANVVPSVSTAIPYSLASADGDGIAMIQRRKPFLRDILNARPISSMYAWWAEQANLDGGADTVAEGAAKPSSDFDIVERTQKVEKVADVIKTSKEVLADVNEMRNLINGELRTQVELKFDDQILSGNGTSPNLKGLLTWAQTASVASTPFATAGTGVNFANNWDVLNAVTAVMGNNSFFEPDTYVLNNMDYALMSMVKTTDGLYIMHPLATAEGQRAAGIRIVTSPAITAGTFVVLDSVRVTLRIREEFNVTAGFENDDFRKNLVMFIGEMRGILYVKTNYAGAVVKGTFATVAAAMETAA